ncbi:glycosyltransferase family 4 protein [bacterium]|nr:glycosyltransferase family 4 protein [bacterium]
MKVGIDISRYIDRSGGVGIYAANLLKFLLKIDTDNQYIGYPFFYDCFPDGWNKEENAGIFSDYYRNPNIYTNFSINKISSRTSDIEKKWVRSSIEGKENILGNADVIHSTAFIVPELLKAKLVVTIHDLSFLLFPDLHTEVNIKLLMQNLIYINSRPDKIICDSYQTKKDLIRFFHVPEEKIKVIYLGVDHIFSDPVSEENKENILIKYGLNDLNYILCVSSIEPRKNFERIIKVFGEIIKDKRYENMLLICAGGPGWKNEAIHNLVKEKSLENKVKFLGYIEEADLPVIYNKALFFMYPSIYEGFGLPVLEAMAAKVPVLTSNVSSLPEVAGNAAITVNPYSEKEIYEASVNLLGNENLRKELQIKGTERSNLFTWENTAYLTLGAYKEVLNK